MSHDNSMRARLEKIQVAREEVIRERFNKESDDEYVRLVEGTLNKVIDATLKFEDQWWLPLRSLGVEEKGIKHERLVEVVDKIEDMTKSNSLMGHALRVKTNHALGRGFGYEFKSNRKDGSLTPKLMKLIEDPHNKATIFSPKALKNINRILWNSGNLFILWDEDELEFSILSVDKRIKNYISYDDDRSRIKYFFRTYTKHNQITVDGETQKDPEVVKEWVPVLEYKEKLKRDKKKLASTIKMGNESIPVNQRAVIIDLRINNDVDETWGIPDAFAAVPWAWASSEYIKDGSKLLKAYASIAYHVKAKTDAAQKKAGGTVQRGRVAGTVISGPDTEINQVNKASAVDLYTGRPIQAMMASATDLSVTSLTNDTGKGGAYGSEQVLTTPELMAALSRQEDFADLFSRLFRAMGIEGTLRFRRLSVDPIHRPVQSIGAARTFGFISQKEGRIATLELLDIEGDPDEMPEPDEFTGSKWSTLEGAVQTDAQGNPLPSQGNTGDIGAMSDGSNELRDEERNS